ncbi:hypothetical protein CDAR_463041 [Caerostris darwini]|uniref:Uncharacterized protein n=1 Tax=Caerostris darwini TaxID=1538125 RepID=A0AAV4QAT9_9ARAC|nr:hypothetical protein CDAR_463041 [Caerostris darwini]
MGFLARSAGHICYLQVCSPGFSRETSRAGSLKTLQLSPGYLHKRHACTNLSLTSLCWSSFLHLVTFPKSGQSHPRRPFGFLSGLLHSSGKRI